MISYDYMYQKTEEGREEEITCPTLVGVDHDTGWITAYTVKKKGFDPYAIQCVVRDVEHAGYNRLILKSDQENSIQEVMRAVKRESRGYRHSP